MQPENAADSMDDLRIKFGGRANEIDADTYVNTLVHFTKLVQAVNKELDADQDIKVSIRTHAPGSFITDLVIYASTHWDQLSNIFTEKNLKYAGSLVATVGGVIKVGKMIWSKSEKKIDVDGDGNVVITNNKGTVNVIQNHVYNIAQAPAVRNEISETFQALSQDPSVESFEIQGAGDQEDIVISNHEFEEIAANAASDQPAANERIEPFNKVVLGVVRISFDARLKSDFLFKGQKISARIADKSFYQRVAAGESFAMGDSLEVNMEARQVFNENLGGFENKAFMIVDVIDHIPRSTQPPLL